MHWLVALQEEPDDGELRAQFGAWKLASPVNAHAWAEAQHAWGVLGEVPAAREASQATAVAANVGAAGRYPKRPSVQGYRILGGLGLMAAACLILVALPSIRIWLEADYTTAVAEIREVQLEDGSSAYLAADSAIAVDFSVQARQVRLLAGEAYFEVKPDVDRPFSVTAGGVDTTVLGTGFDVRLTSRGTAVAVAHGRVAVGCSCLEERAAKPLLAGDWKRVSRDGTVERGKASPDLVAAWRNGTIIVDDAAIGDVVDILGRYFNGRILIIDPDLAQRRVTGLYKLQDPLAALDAVAATHGASLRRLSPWLIVMSKY